MIEKNKKKPAFTLLSFGEAKPAFILTGLRRGEEGVSIYLTLIIMAFILAIILGLSALLLNQIRISSDISDSVQAFYAADTGIEKALMDPDACLSPSGCQGNISSDASYSVKKLVNSNKCSNNPNPPEKYCLQSVGTYRNTTRAIEIKR